jgi:hypothetical protein
MTAFRGRISRIHSNVRALQERSVRASAPGNCPPAAADEFAPAQVCKALRALAGLPCVSLEDATLAASALDRMEGGMDFADALHLGRADACEAFVTFDQRLMKAAGVARLPNVRAP